MKIYRMMLLVVLLLFVGVVMAQDDGISDTLRIELEGIEDYVEGVRGLELKDPLIRVFPSREEVSAFLTESLNEQLTPELINESRGFYASFDLMGVDVDMADVYFRLIEDQIGGYYDPEDKTMNTILITGGELGDDLPVLEETIYAHEFVHTLQDQHFDLQSLGLSVEGVEELPYEQVMALQALVEGDATLVMNLYTNDVQARNPFAAFQILSATVSSGAMNIPEDTPPILLRELYFPYNQGLVFVSTLYAEGGMDAIDAAFANLPVSTEHILHPETYLNGEMPIAVSLADTSAALPDGWTLLREETLGEFYLRAYLDTQLASDVYAEAAKGWGGDTYHIYQFEDNTTYAMLTRFTWDTATDADEFAGAFEQFGAAKFETEATDGCWSSEGDALCLAVMDNGDTLISRAPTLDMAQALRDSQS